MNRNAIADIIKTMYDIERKLDDLFKHQAKKFGISYSEFLIFYSFTLEDIPKTAQHLAEENFLSKQTASSALLRMKKKGWIQDTPGNDKREKLISMTKTGRAFRHQTTDRLLHIDATVMNKIGLDEIRHTLAL